MAFTVVHNNRYRTPFARSLTEMLHAAGLLGWAEQVGVDVAAPIVVLPACWLTPDEQKALTSFVAEGGTLIASRPPLPMAEVFGWKPTGRVLNNGYLRLTNHSLLHHAPRTTRQTLQCPSAMDLYERGSGDALAWRCDPLEGDERYPAIVMNPYGKGVAMAFAFDVADCVVRFHQGIAAQANDQPDGDPCGMGSAKPNDLFVGLMDARLRLIPQADVYQRLLVGLIEQSAAQRSIPLLRLWQFPGGVPAMATLTGDSDGMKREHFEQVLSLIEEQGGRYTLYLLEEHRDQISPQDADALRREGHGLSHHTWVGYNPPHDEMRAGVKRQFDGFKDRYGFQPLSHRGHSCIWVGYVAQAQYLSENGVRLDGNHYAYVHHQYGFLSGSGQAFRFVDERGCPMDIWEQPTLMSDDCMLQDKTLLPPFRLNEAIERSRELIDALADRWHGVYHPCFHPVYMRTDWNYVYSAPWIGAVAVHCRERGVPMLSAEMWAAFIQARRGVRLLNQKQQDETLEFTLQAEQPISNAALLLPDGFTCATAQPRWLEGREQQVVVVDMPKDAPVSVTLTARL
jgi:hypothetical protein